MMNIQSKFLLFYIALSASERQKLQILIGPSLLYSIASQSDISEAIEQSLEELGTTISRKSAQTSEVDAALIQIVRHIIRMSESNLQMSKAIEGITGRLISRPEKRSQYELKGLLLEALLGASSEEMRSIRNHLVHRQSGSKKPSPERSNLERWFNIILEQKP